MSSSTSLKIALCLCAFMCGFDVASANVTACTINKLPILCNATDLWTAWNCTVDRCITAMGDCSGSKCGIIQVFIEALLGSITVAVAEVIIVVAVPAKIVVGVTVIINICVLLASIVNIVIVVIGPTLITADIAVVSIEACVSWISNAVTLLLLFIVDADIFIQVFIVIKIIFCIIIDIIVECIGI